MNLIVNFLGGVGGFFEVNIIESKCLGYNPLPVAFELILAANKKVYFTVYWNKYQLSFSLSAITLEWQKSNWQQRYLHSLAIARALPQLFLLRMEIISGTILPSSFSLNKEDKIHQVNKLKCIAYVNITGKLSEN